MVSLNLGVPRWADLAFIQSSEIFITYVFTVFIGVLGLSFIIILYIDLIEG